jgi:hypothetical protein
MSKSLILISHRGNLEGKNIDLENRPQYILQAIKAGYDVEIDVWFKNDSFFLGHDEPQYQIDDSFLMNNKLWCHAKNLEALRRMLQLGCHCFWHQNDDYTITSRGEIWVYPGKELSLESICVMPETFCDVNNHRLQCKGICSDFIKKFS